MRLDPDYDGWYPLVPATTRPGSTFGWLQANAQFQRLRMPDAQVLPQAGADLGADHISASAGGRWTFSPVHERYTPRLTWPATEKPGRKKAGQDVETTQQRPARNSKPRRGRINFPWKDTLNPEPKHAGAEQQSALPHRAQNPKSGGVAFVAEAWVRLRSWWTHHHPLPRLVAPRPSGTLLRRRVRESVGAARIKPNPCRNARRRHIKRTTYSAPIFSVGLNSFLEEKENLLLDSCTTTMPPGH